MVGDEQYEVEVDVVVDSELAVAAVVEQQYVAVEVGRSVVVDTAEKYKVTVN
jgi:hypothetical protein